MDLLSKEVNSLIEINDDYQNQLEILSNKKCMDQEYVHKFMSKNLGEKYE